MKNSSKFFVAAAIISLGFIFFNTQIKNNLKPLTRNKFTLDSPTQNSNSSFSKDLDALHGYWDHIHKARYYIEKGNYTEAKQEYNLAIKTSRSDGDIWMARALLEELYEKTGEYDLALKEIDWLIENSSRADVISDLSQKRKDIISNRSNPIHRTPL